MHLSSKYYIKIFDEPIVVWYRTHVTLYFMKKIIFSFLVSSFLFGTAFAGQCSNLDVFSTSNPRNSSLSGEDLCDIGTASSVTYSASRERWTYTCSGGSGGVDSCIVDLAQENVGDCDIEVTDKGGVVPFST